MMELPNSFQWIVEMPAAAAIVAKWTLLLLIAWMLHGLLRNANPRWRVLLWRTAVVGLVLIPICHFATPPSVHVQPRAVHSVVVATPVVDEVGLEEAVAPPATSGVEQRASIPLVTTGSSDGLTTSIITRDVMLTACFALGALVCAIRLLIGWYQVQRLRRDSMPVYASTKATLQRVVADLGVGENVNVRVSTKVSAPTLCGLFHSVLLIPERMEDESYADELPAVFAHELSHVKSCDLRWNCLIHTITSVLWFHPLMWFARTAHTSACESVSDAVAADYLGSVRDYTRTLARVALDAYAAPSLSMGMARTADVRRRIETLQRYLFARELRPVSTMMVAIAALAVTVAIGGVNIANADDPTNQDQTEQVAAKEKKSKKEQQGKNSLASLITPETAATLEKGLAFLVSQQRADGSFGDGSGGDQQIAVTALCGLALLGDGSQPGAGKFGKQIDLCLDFVLNNAQPNGLLTGKGGLLYVHAYALRFLSEAHIASPDEKTKDAIANAVDVLVKSQNDRDGWRYQVNSKDADSSITSCLMVALLAARRAGADVPQETVDRAFKYLESCQLDDGGFAYVAGAGAKSGLQRSAAAMAAILASDSSDKQLVKKGVAYLKKSAGTSKATDGHFYYGEYYLSMAMPYVGKKPFRKWYQMRREQLLASQAEDGSWSKTYVGPEYSAANACIVLQSPGHVVKRLKTN